MSDAATVVCTPAAVFSSRVAGYVFTGALVESAPVFLSDEQVTDASDALYAFPFYVKRRSWPLAPWAGGKTP